MMSRWIRTVSVVAAILVTATLVRAQDVAARSSSKAMMVAPVDFRPNPYSAPFKRTQWLTLAAYKAVLDAVASGNEDRIQKAIQVFVVEYNQMIRLRNLDTAHEKAFSRLALFALANPQDLTTRPPQQWVAGEIGLEARFEKGHEIIIGGQRLPDVMGRRFATSSRQLVMVKHLPSTGLLTARGWAPGHVYSPMQLSFPARPTGEPLTVILEASIGARVHGLVTGPRIGSDPASRHGALFGALVTLTHARTGKVYSATTASVQAADGSADKRKTDAEGASGAAVDCVSPAPSNFWLRGLPVGPYSVRVEMAGFAPYAPDERLQVESPEARIRLDVTLVPAGRSVSTPVADPLQAIDAELPLAGGVD